MWDRLISITDEMLSAARAHVVLDQRARELRPLRACSSAPTACSIAQGTYSVPVVHRHRRRPRCATCSTRFPAETLRAGRRDRHQRSVDRHRPPLRHQRDARRCSARGRHRRLLDEHHAPARHRRRAASRRPRARSTRKGCACPSAGSCSAGEPNRELLELIRTNVRVPDQIVGDLHANVTCNDGGGPAAGRVHGRVRARRPRPARRRQILELSERAMRERIREIPRRALRAPHRDRGRGRADHARLRA